MKINGQSVSIIPYQFIDAFQFYPESTNYLRKNLSMTATMADQLQNYSQAYNGTPNMIGESMDPLTSFGNSSQVYGEGRGSY